MKFDLRTAYYDMNQFRLKKSVVELTGKSHDPENIGNFIISTIWTLGNLCLIFLHDICILCDFYAT